MAAKISTFLFDAQLRTGSKTAYRVISTIQLIAVVAAVVKAVTSHGTVDAMTASASELMRQAESLGLCKFVLRNPSLKREAPHLFGTPPLT